MPWRTQTIIDERARFVFEAERSDLPFAELCRRYGIIRPTVYKWVDRHFEVRLVSSIGGIRWKSRTVWVTELLARCRIGLERIADDLWGVYFGRRHLGWLDESDFRIMKLRRRSTLT
jgi:hypothetical protein